MALMLRRHTLLVTVLAAASMAGGCGRTKEPSSVEQASLDKRQAVTLPAEGQQAVLGEMRQMLAAMGGAMTAAAHDDTTALLAVLKPAGTAAAADPALEALLPAEWKELAERTHGGFDSLMVAGRQARRGTALRDTVLIHLSRISASCTSCHETFRVAIGAGAESVRP